MHEDSWAPVTQEHMDYVLGPVFRGNHSVWIQRWGRMANVVRPYRLALEEYGEGATIQVHPRLLMYERKLKVQDGFLQLGFIPGPVECKGTFVRHPSEADRLYQRRHSQRKKQRTNAANQQRLNAQALQQAANMATLRAGELVALDEERSETATYTGSEWSYNQDFQVADLETKIVELTRQIRVLRARRGDLGRPAIQHQHPVILGGRYVVTTEGGDVNVELNYLDPDRAPYYVICDSSGQLLPCVVLGGRRLTFRAPPQTKGCVPLTVMCECPPGSLQRYCKSVWLEYKSPRDLKNEVIPEMSTPASPTQPTTTTTTTASVTSSSRNNSESNNSRLQLCSPPLPRQPRGSLRRSSAKRRPLPRNPSVREEVASPEGPHAPPAPAMQASPGNRCVSWYPVLDEEDISTEGSASMYMLRPKSCDPDFEDYFSMFEDGDVGPEITSNHSKPTSYSSGSEEGEANDDADSLSRGQGSTISNPSICSRCTSVSRASSIQRARVIESLRSLAISYTTTAIGGAPVLDFGSCTTIPPMVTPVVHQAPSTSRPTNEVPPTSKGPPSVSAEEARRILLTRNVLEWHNEETCGQPHPKAPASPGPWPAPEGHASSSSLGSMPLSNIITSTPNTATCTVPHPIPLPTLGPSSATPHLAPPCGPSPLPSGLGGLNPFLWPAVGMPYDVGQCPSVRDTLGSPGASQGLNGPPLGLGMPYMMPDSLPHLTNNLNPHLTVFPGLPFDTAPYFNWTPPGDTVIPGAGPKPL